MRTHPVFLCLEGRRCVVIGGDAAAAGKAAACVGAGADVTVVAPAVTPELERLIDERQVTHLARAYREGDLAGAVLAYASTHEAALIGRLVAEAARERVLLNVMDVPEASGFLSPAVVERGEVRIAIGTGGASPAVAVELKREIARHVGPEWGPYTAILGAVRRRLVDDPARAEVLKALLGSPLLDLVRRGAADEIDALLRTRAGEECALGRLGVVVSPAEAGG